MNETERKTCNTQIPIHTPMAEKQAKKTCEHLEIVSYTHTHTEERIQKVRESEDERS